MSIEVKNVSKVYSHQKALDNVSFSITEGQIVGFLGPNGAGKSTMMKIITGFLPATLGSVNVYGIDVSDENLETRKIIGYLPEHNPLYLDLYVKEYLAFVGGIYKIPKINNRISELIEMTGLKLEQNKKIGALSKGYRQRVGLAQALLPDPKVLILDEPTTGLDPNQIVEVRELIKNFGKEKTILLSTHIMQEVQAICDRVIIINQGQIVADSKADQLTSLTFEDNQIIDVEFLEPINTHLLSQLAGVLGITALSNTTYQLKTSSKQDIRADLFHFAVANNYVIISMMRKGRSLEEAFHELTGLSGS